MGVLQLHRRGSSDPLYAPARDVVYLFPNIINKANALLEDACDPNVQALLDQHQITLDDLGEVAGAFCRFMNGAHENPEESVEDVLRRCGWFETKPVARVAYMYHIGTCTGATFFRGIRDVVSLGERTLASIEQIQWTVKRVILLARMGRWQRWFYRWWAPYRRKLWRKYKIKAG